LDKSGLIKVVRTPNGKKEFQIQMKQRLKGRKPNKVAKEIG